MGLSGHCCQQSLTSYNRPTEEDKLRTSLLLAESSPAAGPVSVHPEVEGIDFDLLFAPVRFSSPAADTSMDLNSLIRDCTGEERWRLDTPQRPASFEW